MQEQGHDYSEENIGCCLNCPDAYPGCLCSDCCCKKCYWYCPPEEYDGENGHCDKTDHLKEERKKRFKEELTRKAYEKYLISKKLKEDNKKKEREIKIKGKVPFYYTCQCCKREFVSDKELKITEGKEPFCYICNG